MSYSYQDLLRGTGVSTLEVILGKEAVALCTALAKNDLRPKEIRRLVLDLKEPSDLFRDNDSRIAMLRALPKPSAKQLAKDLGLAVGADPYSSLEACRFTRNSKKERILFDFVGIPHDITSNVPVYKSIEEITPHYPLFSHQIDVAHRAWSIFEKEGRRLVIHMPTGAGKTRTAMNIIARFLRGSQHKVVWLASSEELCEQAALEFERAWKALGNRPINVYRFFGQHSVELSDFTDGLMVTGLAKLYAAYTRDATTLGSIGYDTGMIIFDEAHQALAETYSEMLFALAAINPESLILGLSATPGRTYNDVAEDRRLSAIFGQTKVELRIEGYANPMQFLIDEGFLSRPSYYPLNYETDLTADQISLIQKSLDIPESILRHLSQDSVRNLTILNRILNLTERHNRIILFATSVAHSELMATVMAAQGLDAASITSTTSSDSRERRLRYFKEETDDCRILCNYGVLTTGFDAPQTSCVVIARPTKSLVLYSQMVGRGLRGGRVGGTPRCEVWTVTDLGIPGFRDVTEAIHNWEDVWKSDTI